MEVLGFDALAYLAECSHFRREEFRGHEVGHRLHPEIDAEDEDAAKDDAAPVDDHGVRLHVPVFQVGGEEQGGAEGGEAAHRGDGRGEVEVSPLEPDEQAGEGERGDETNCSNENGGIVGVLGEGWTSITVTFTHRRGYVVVQLVHSRGEHSAKDLDDVASENGRSAELLGDTEEQDDEERLVHLRVLLEVLHVVHLVHGTRPLLLEAKTDLLHVGQGVITGLVDLHQRLFGFRLLSDGDEMNRRFWGSEEQEKCEERNHGGVESNLVPGHEGSKSIDKDHAWSI